MGNSWEKGGKVKKKHMLGRITLILHPPDSNSHSICPNYPLQTPPLSFLHITRRQTHVHNSPKFPYSHHWKNVIIYNGDDEEMYQKIDRWDKIVKLDILEVKGITEHVLYVVADLRYLSELRNCKWWVKKVDIGVMERYVSFEEILDIHKANFLNKKCD